jgi:membrane protease YdiL (CAAX protease family)
MSGKASVVASVEEEKHCAVRGSPRTRAQRTLAYPWAAAALCLSGCAALLARPWIIQRADPTTALALLFAALFVGGWAWPAPETASQPRRDTSMLIVIAVGAAAVLSAYLLVSGPPHGAIATRFVILDVVAAVAEEAFFRRLLFALLRPAGAIAAIVGSAGVFALVHVTVYGAWVLPIDLGVGLLFAWQREASGSWISSAVTHTFANLLVVL